MPNGGTKIILVSEVKQISSNILLKGYSQIMDTWEGFPTSNITLTFVHLSTLFCVILLILGIADMYMYRIIVWFLFIFTSFN